MEPKAKKEYKTKKDKEKYAVVEELIALRQTMVGEELRDEEAQSIKTWWRKTRRPLHAKLRRKQRRKTKQTQVELRPKKGLLHPSPKRMEKLRLMWAC